MGNKYFGTDGIRGTVNQGNITGEKFFKFGLAAATYFKNQRKTKQIAIIAKDTRLSGYSLEPALVSGLTSGGMHVFTLGPLPTNGLAMLTKLMKANMGIMITASHNPYYDNGLKLFGPNGMKLSDRIEKKIEKLIEAKNTRQLTNPKLLGRVKRLEDGNDRYIEILRKNFPKNFNLRGTKIVLDCGNGAGYIAAPKLLKNLGAKVVSIGVKPNGFNINDKCGSTYPSKIQSAVRKHKAHVGISFDGDADRIIMCDENSKIIDGDQIIAMLARRWKVKKILKGGVIGTLMSNYGLAIFLRNEKTRFFRSKVGDRYVKEKMKKLNFNLGGEQSGHIILGKFATTGDGLMVALEVLFSLRKGRKASELLNVFVPMPQILENIMVKDKNIINKPKCKNVIKKANELMGNRGRLLIRKSGTEPKIRIMGESYNKKLILKCLKLIKKTIK
jgi:phosphoglucosamine mutase